MRNELYHFGIKGMHWGIRRFQRNDGTLTSSGKKRYGDSNSGSRGNTSKISPRTKKIAIGVGAGIAATAVSALVISKSVKRKSLGIVAEMSAKRGAEIRQNAQRGLDYMNRLRAKQQSAMNAANRAFDALNRR